MRKWFVIVCMLVTPWLYGRSYLDVGARIGLGGLAYDCNYGGTVPGYHAAFDIGYLYKSPYWVAFRIGATIEASSSSYRKSNYQDNYTITDLDGEQMNIRYLIGVLRERHSWYDVSFPVQIGFHIDHFTFLVGPRFTLPLGASWKETLQDASLAVYYPKYDNLIEESYPLAASKSFSMEQSGDLRMRKWDCSLSGELMYDFLVHSQYGKAESFVSVGVYFDAGLMKAPTYPDQEQWGVLHLTDMKSGFPLTRVLNPVLTAWYEQAPLVNKFSTFAVGVKVAYRLTSAPRQRHSHHGCNCSE